MKKKVTAVVIGSMIGVVFLLIWSRFIDFSVVSDYIRNLKIQFVLISIAFYFAAYFVRSLRWGVLLKGIIVIPKVKLFLIMMAGNFTNYFVPMRAGEFMKSYFIKKRYGMRMSRTLPSVFVDKLFDTMGILIVLLLVPILSVSLPPVLNILVVIIFIILLTGWAFILLAVKAGDQIILYLKRLLFFIPKKYEEKLHEKISLFVEGLAVFRNHTNLLLPVFSLSILAVVLDSFFFFSLFLAFGTEINYFYVLLGYTLIYLSYIIPHPPVQLGSNELIMLLIFAAGFGIQAEAASAIMLFSHFLTGLVIIAVGIAAYSYAGIEIMTIIRKGEEIYD